MTEVSSLSPHLYIDMGMVMIDMGMVMMLEQGVPGHTRLIYPATPAILASFTSLGETYS